MSQENVNLAREFLNRLAKAARIRTDHLHVNIADSYHYADGYLKALLDFAALTREEHEALHGQFRQWPAPLKSDGSQSEQPWIEHRTEPLFIKRIDLSILNKPDQALYTYECEYCYLLGRRHIRSDLLELEGDCDDCKSDVILYKHVKS